MISDSLIERQIHDLLGSEASRLSPTALLRAVRACLPSSEYRQIRSVIRAMVTAGELVYSHRFGISQLELHRYGPMRVSDRIVLHPQYGNWPSKAGDCVVRVIAGASFGCGDHPTTRLALRALDVVVARVCRDMSLATLTDLDIGTGNGVLAVAAALLGVKHAVGIDIDPLACHEAVLNAKANGVDHKVSILAGSVENLPAGPYDLVLANVRPPTLVRMAGRIRELTSASGFWILSGFRVNERSEMEAFLPGNADSVWLSEERGWGVSVYRF